MRPPVGGNAPPATSCKQSFPDLDATTPAAGPPHGGPTTFFIATESMLDGSGISAPASGSDSNYGVRSLEETREETTESTVAMNDTTEKGAEQGEEQDDVAGIHHRHRRSTIRPRVESVRDGSSDSLGQVSGLSSPESSPVRIRKRRQQPDNDSHPMTPISFTSPVLGSSVPGSPKSVSTRSLRHSDEESFSDGGSQAIVSSGDEGGDGTSNMQRAAPQLIMPSIMMPSRRPFTERGNSLGKLKVLLAGGSGVGKTSLIKSIVQTCEDIVHVDPISTTTPSLSTASIRKSKGRTGNIHYNPTNRITEIYASTKAYPPWWSEFEESTILRRRKSAGDTVLERNVCFVDTPGHGSGTSTIEDMKAVIRYIEAQMEKTVSISNMADAELLSILGGNGGFQVDVVFYLIAQNLNPADLEFLKQLSQMTNVIPLVAKSDTLSNEDVKALKTSISEELRTAGVKTFVFSTNQPSASPFYTVCSSRSKDEDNMDASLLMSPDYVQPLLPSELGTLIDQVFNKDNASWLKHSAAKKVIKWRRAPQSLPTVSSPLRTALPLNPSGSTASPLTPSSPSLTSASSSEVLVPYHTGPLSFAQARIADHMQREERLAQIHLANWAGNLQRSLQNERARYEALARVEQAAWLKERMDECVLEEETGEVSSSKALVTKARRRELSSSEPSSLVTRYGLTNAVDPLGLMGLNDSMKKHGWVTFQVIGSFGILGAAVVWVARTWGWSWDWGFGGDGIGGFARYG